MSFMGELRDIGVADLLYLLALRRQTGKLAVSANGDEVSLYLDKGQMILVTSSNMALRLGRMLVRMGFLNSDQLREALLRQENGATAQPLGSLLLQHSYITEPQLSQCVEEQCIEILSRVIAVEQGVFIYHKDVPVPARTEIVPLNADRIILEATRRTDELARLRDLLPDEHAPLMLSTDVEVVAETLSDAEVFVSAALQAGATSVNELAAQLSMEQVALWRTIISMRERGLLVTGRSAAVNGMAVATVAHPR